ncbi:MAG: TonB-dependent receptor [Flavobacteriales bacterium]|nr:MAG: TonB-dependent receptor [Flavobacteriales bacterium]
MKIPHVLLALSVSCAAQAQTFTISGHVKDATSGEAIIGASIFVTNTKAGTAANEFGFYSISLPASDTLNIVIASIGYTAQAKRIKLSGNLVLDILMVPSATQLAEAVVTAKRLDKNITDTRMGVIDVPIEKLRVLPAILGEPDVLKMIQLLPGVQAGQEGTTGFYVRGGNSDQNLVQLDGAVVYNPNHLFGLFSTFNSNALNRVELTKGGFPARYGGRLSSVLDVTMKEGNDQKMHVHAGIGLITSNVTVEGPIKKNVASYIVSARRTYVDLILKPLKVFGSGNTYNFYDLNAKVNWRLGAKDRVFLSGFTGQDNATYTDASSLNYGIRFGNGTVTARWNHLLGPKMFVNTSAIYNSYLLNLSSVQGKYYSQFYSAINDIGGKTEFEYFPNPRHTISFGLHYIYHTFSPSGKSAKIPRSQQITNLDLNRIAQTYSSEMAAYLNDNIKVTERIGAELGVRLPYYITKGAEYLRVEPRASLRYTVNERSSIKGAYTVMNQFLHVVPSSTATFPTDIWIQSTARTKPQYSEQYALGYFRNFHENAWETSIELYTKNMKNQVAFKEGSQLLEQTVIDSNLVYGKGWSQGAELFIKKNQGKLTGWVSYTLSWTNQQFAALNRGKEFPFKYDRRHNLALVGTYAFNEHWTFSAQFVFTTGAAYTLPTGRATVLGGGTLYDGIYYDYTDRNNARLNPYHRLDLSASYKKQHRMFKHDYMGTWTIGLYNAYSRQNPYFVYLTTDPVTKQPQAKQVSLLPIIPSLSYNLEF